MTEVSPVGAASAQPAKPVAEGAAGASAVGKTPTLDYDAFLKLLVAQMKNQDPLEPMSETEYVAQLASFSNVEQNIITNERLAAMMTANALGDAGGLVGRKISTAEGTEGTVEKVTLVTDGTLATLTDGTEVLVGEGVTVY